jgi:arginyl-tRNA--protein-N-Asp/Glu arginylyltransferase
MNNNEESFFSDDELLELFERYFEKMDFNQDQIDECIMEFEEMNIEDGQEFIVSMMVALNMFVTMIPTGANLN